MHAGDRDALLLAARQLVGPGVGLVGEAEQAEQMARPPLVPAGSASGVVETPAITFCSAVSDDSRLRFWNRKRMRLRSASSCGADEADGVGAEQLQLALGRPAHGAEDGEQRRLARARRAGDDHQLALADLHVDVEQHVDALRALAVVVMDVDRLDDRRAQDVAVDHGHSNSMMGSTFHRRRIANTLDTAVMTIEATSATTISRRPMVMPRWIVASATP